MVGIKCVLPWSVLQSVTTGVQTYYSGISCVIIMMMIIHVAVCSGATVRVNAGTAHLAAGHGGSTSPPRSDSLAPAARSRCLVGGRRVALLASADGSQSGIHAINSPDAKVTRRRRVLNLNRGGGGGDTRSLKSTEAGKPARLYTYGG